MPSKLGVILRWSLPWRGKRRQSLSASATAREGHRGGCPLRRAPRRWRGRRHVPRHGDTASQNPDATGL
jgi:hypothetical protein